MSEQKSQYQEFQEGQIPENFENQPKTSKKRSHSSQQDSDEIVYVTLSESAKDHKKKVSKDLVQRTKNTLKKVPPPFFSDQKQLEKPQKDSIHQQRIHQQFHDPHPLYDQQLFHQMNYGPQNRNLMMDPNQIKRYPAHPQSFHQGNPTHPLYYNYGPNQMNPYSHVPPAANSIPYYNNSNAIRPQYVKPQMMNPMMKPPFQYIDAMGSNEAMMKQKITKNKLQLNRIMQGLTNKQQLIKSILNLTVKTTKQDIQLLMTHHNSEEDFKKILQALKFLNLQQIIFKIKERNLQVKLLSDTKLQIQRFTKQANERQKKDPRLKQ